MLERLSILAQDLMLRRQKPAPIDTALREAAAWICRAQDSTPDRGVSHSYLLGKGWAPSYPETTGYIIPTLLNWSKVSDDSEARQRALQMADWECEIQLKDGSVMASVVGTVPVKSAVFNTGQVMFGWLGAYRETRDDKYLDSATRAGTWLVNELGAQQTWQTFGNMGDHKAHTFNIRVAWAVLEWGRLVGDSRSRDAIRKVIEWALTQEKSPGWFDGNCLTDDGRPLLHTIAYTARGLLESGLLIDDSRCIDAATRTADALIAKIDANGRMAGRFDSQWREAVNWSCLTGMAQMSIIWQKLFAITGQNRYCDAAVRVNEFLRSIQRVRSGNPGIRGGIPGSHPINGAYGKCRMLNWAVKFYIDALLLESQPSLTDSPEYHPG